MHNTQIITSVCACVICNTYVSTPERTRENGSVAAARLAEVESASACAAKVPELERASEVGKVIDAKLECAGADEGVEVGTCKGL